MKAAGGTPSGATRGGVAAIVRDLRIERGGRLVIDSLSLDLPAGRVSGLLGPSGSGKSTLFRALVGVQRIAGGTVTVLGLPAGVAELRRRVGYMTQAPSIYGDLTVRENLRYFAGLLGARERIDATIELVDLARHSGSLVRDLSGGERSRASLAVALVGAPELVVLDEPTVGLDPVLRRDLWGTFNRLAGEGVTVVVSTHVMDEADRCEQLYLMHEGRIAAAGRPDELLARAGAHTMEDAFLTLADRA